MNEPKLEEVAELMCQHLYGIGHRKYYTRSLILQALKSAVCSDLRSFLNTLVTTQEAPGRAKKAEL